MSSAAASNERPLRVEQSGSVTDTEEGRAFFQRRLSILGLAMFILAGATWLAMTVVRLTSVGPAAVLKLDSAMHLYTGLLGGGLWLATRSGARRGGLLHAFDLFVMLSLSLSWATTNATIPDATIASFVTLLSYTSGTLGRAIVVPSTARRTLAIAVAGAVAIVAVTIVRAPPGEILGGAVATAGWCTTGVTLATLASHTIFGLRREVQRARVLGQYTLETRIGEGGMGDVWRAQHALLRRPTAIKLLPPGRMEERAIQRFEREVQLTARLTHPNTVAIYDYGRTRDGIFYYAMELLDGVDLERLISAHGPQPPGRVVHILMQICGALAEAHDHGLVHRDVKPANVLLSLRKNEHEVAKIVDFGLVKSIDRGALDPGVTTTNTITGTPLYMAPEAIEAPDAVDARSDLYALGAVAWFMLVGRPVFEGATVVAVCGHHLHTPPRRPSEALGRPLPEDLQDVVMACLEKKPASRPQDARALRAKLERCAAAGGWTGEHAAEWWSTHSATPSRKPLQTLSKTIALDVAARAAG
ncbi:MAG TPA: serine/threonine-protein kinase [Polyangiaceae bacterium]|nr:serine/threonine-protein kinase [Polyangiaceae bacterium]